MHFLGSCSSDVRITLRRLIENRAGRLAACVGCWLNWWLADWHAGLIYVSACWHISLLLARFTLIDVYCSAIFVTRCMHEPWR